MRAVWLDVPEEFLEERHRLGLDRKDELWDGELHMVPPPASRHALISRDLYEALVPIARPRGLEVSPEGLGLFGSTKNYRIPDVVIWRAEHLSQRGLEGAMLVVEVLSPHDEAREKQPFYAQVGVPESWIIDPVTRALEVYTLVGGRYVPAPPGRSPLLDIAIELVDGPKLRLIDGEYVADV